MARISSILTNLFLILLLVQLAPAFIKNIKKNYTGLLEPKTKVGLITIKGALGDASQPARDIKKFFENKEIKAILIKMDCQGCCAGTAQALFHEIKTLKKQHLKPIIVWVQNICTSGGYYIACATDYIIATPSSFIGSIGAYIPHPQFKKFIDMLNIHYAATKAGEYKTAGNPLLEMTKEQKDMFQSLVDDTYQQFTSDVAEQRPKLALHAKKLWAEGKIFTGRQALALGLIDELGSQITVEQHIKQKAAIEGALEWVRPTCKSTFYKIFMDCDDDETTDSSSITSAVKTATTTACEYIDQRMYGMGAMTAAEPQPMLVEPL